MIDGNETNAIPKYQIRNNKVGDNVLDFTIVADPELDKRLKRGLELVVYNYSPQGIPQEEAIAREIGLTTEQWRNWLQQPAMQKLYEEYLKIVIDRVENRKLGICDAFTHIMLESVKKMEDDLAKIHEPGHDPVSLKKLERMATIIKRLEKVSSVTNVLHQPTFVDKSDKRKVEFNVKPGDAKNLGGVSEQLNELKNHIQSIEKYIELEGKLNENEDEETDEHQQSS